MGQKSLAKHAENWSPNAPKIGCQAYWMKFLTRIPNIVTVQDCKKFEILIFEIKFEIAVFEIKFKITVFEITFSN